ncbi:MAG: hypothetical protein ACLU4J_03665 [Butyricimonas paravirosa]
MPVVHWWKHNLEIQVDMVPGERSCRFVVEDKETGLRNTIAFPEREFFTAGI